MGLSHTSFGDEFINKINRKLQERVMRNTQNVQESAPKIKVDKVSAAAARSYIEKKDSSDGGNTPSQHFLSPRPTQSPVWPTIDNNNTRVTLS